MIILLKLSTAKMYWSVHVAKLEY